MTFTVDSIWVLCGLGIVAGIGLGFGGYLGLCAAITWRKASIWVGGKMADLILRFIRLFKLSWGNRHD